MAVGEFTNVFKNENTLLMQKDMIISLLIHKSRTVQSDG